MWGWVGKAIENVVGSAVATFAWNLLGDQVKRFYQPQPNAETASTAADAYTVPQVATSKPRPYQSQYPSRGDGVAGDAGNIDSLPETISLPLSDISVLSQFLDAASLSMNSASTSLAGLQHWFDTLPSAASPHTTVNPGVMGDGGWGDPQENGGPAGPPALPPFHMAPGGVSHPGESLTSEDRTKELQEELRNLLAGRTTAPIPANPAFLPQGYTSVEREPMASPTPSSADGSSPESIIKELAASLATSQGTTETQQQNAPTPPIMPVPLTPSAVAPLPMTRLAPPIGTAAPIATPLMPPSTGAPQEGAKPVTTPLMPPITGGPQEGTKPVAVQAPLTKENVGKYNSKPKGIDGSKEGANDNNDAKTVKSDDSSSSQDSVFTAASGQTNQSVATTVGSGGRGK